MKRHLRRYGALYVLVALFLGSWVGQFVAQVAEVRQDASAHGEPFLWSEFWPQFLAATFENWQSEFLQLFVQAFLIASVLLGPKMFAADRSPEQADLDRVETKVDQIRDALGLTEGDAHPMGDH
jgi:hypothetical protein